MRPVAYALRMGLIGLWRHRVPSAVAVLTIALAVVVLGIVLLATSNVRAWLVTRASTAQLSVYVADASGADVRAAVERTLDASGVVSEHHYVSKEEARALFREATGDLAAVIDGLEDNPFPASIEATLRPGVGEGPAVDDLVSRLATLVGVADVRDDRQWVGRLETLTARTQLLGTAVAAVFAMAAAIMVGTVVRLGLYARREEVEIMRLAGAPLSYLQGPFVAEGLIAGGLGAVIALALLRGLFRLLVGFGAPAGGIVSMSTIHFLPVSMGVGLVIGGMAVGALGGFAASRRVV